MYCLCGLLSDAQFVDLNGGGKPILFYQITLCIVAAKCHLFNGNRMQVGVVQFCSLNIAIAYKVRSG